mmetsp:Transcript_58186/g.125788  ORF Transcript_58186/g.125788 Transcript_58186/m.125788 type:complete len:200 (+) Transcript_58186:689-1288(+)
MASPADIFGCPGSTCTASSMPWATRKQAMTTLVGPKPSSQCTKQLLPEASTPATSETTAASHRSSDDRGGPEASEHTRCERPSACSAGRCCAFGVALAANSPHRSQEKASGQGDVHQVGASSEATSSTIEQCGSPGEFAACSRLQTSMASSLCNAASCFSSFSTTNALVFSPARANARAMASTTAASEWRSRCCKAQPW